MVYFASRTRAFVASRRCIGHLWFFIRSTFRTRARTTALQTRPCDHWHHYVYSDDMSIYRRPVSSILARWLMLNSLFASLDRAGAFFLQKRPRKGERLTDPGSKVRMETFSHDQWAGEGTWRIAHRILGSLVLALGLVNISLGVFLAVLPSPVWIIWYIYLGFLVLLLVGLELVALLRRGASRKGGSLKLPGKHERTSQRR